MAATVPALALSQPIAAKNSHSAKLEKALDDLAGRSGLATRVIIRVRPDQADDVKKAVVRSRGTVKFDHPSIAAIDAEVRADALDALAEMDGFEGLSIDALVGYGETTLSGANRS